MAKELQVYFETKVLEFLKSCQAEDGPLYGTRRTLGRLAEAVSSVSRIRSSSLSTDASSSVRINGLSTSTEDMSSNDEVESRDIPSDYEEWDDVGGASSRIGRGVTTRSRSQRKRHLEDSENVSSVQQRGIVTRSASKRIRVRNLSYDDEDKFEEEGDEEPVTSCVVTRTGRVVKPTVKY